MSAHYSQSCQMMFRVWSACRCFGYGLHVVPDSGSPWASRRMPSAWCADNGAFQQVLISLPARSCDGSCIRVRLFHSCILPCSNPLAISADFAHHGSNRTTQQLCNCSSFCVVTCEAVENAERDCHALQTKCATKTATNLLRDRYQQAYFTSNLFVIACFGC